MTGEQQTLSENDDTHLIGRPGICMLRIKILALVNALMKDVTLDRSQRIDPQKRTIETKYMNSPIPSRVKL